jgi:hypothetical protein
MTSAQTEASMRRCSIGEVWTKSSSWIPSGHDDCIAAVIIVLGRRRRAQRERRLVTRPVTVT